MGSISNFAETEMLDHILGNGSYTPPTIYLALSTTDFLDTGAGGTEPVAMGYIRKAISFGAAASRVVTQNADVDFDEATGSWGTMAYWAIFDQAALGGNCLAWGALNAGVAVGAGQTPSIASGQVTITGSAGKISTYLANAILDHLFNASNYTVPSIFVALTSAAILDADGGDDITELTMTGYAREACSGWTVSGDAAYNTALIDFGTLTSTGQTVEGACLTDNATTALGEVLFYDNTPSQAIADGDAVQFPAGDFDVSLD